MKNELPVHRLNQLHTTTWLLGKSLQHTMASALIQRYKGGCAIAAATNRVFCVVDPRGNVRILPKPWHTVDMSSIANKPNVVDCQCAEWYYPECCGPWRLMESLNHHPICQFEKVSSRVFELHATKPADRPDELERTRQQVAGTVGASNLRPA